MPREGHNITYALAGHERCNLMEISDSHKMRNFLFFKKGGGAVFFKNVNLKKHRDCRTIPDKRRLKNYDS